MEKRRPLFGSDEEGWTGLFTSGVLRAAVLGVVLSVGGYVLALLGAVAAFVVADWWADRKIT